MKFEFYKHIEEDGELEDLKTLLNQHEIQFEVTSPETIIDTTIVGTGMFAKYTLKLLPADFKKANAIFKDFVNSQNLQIEDFPHLDSMTSDELFEVLLNPNDWSLESEVIAKKILKSRNYEYSEEEIEKVKLEEEAFIRQGKSVNVAVQFFYLLAIIFGGYLSIIFVIAGLGMGYYYAFGKTTDKKGISHYVYDDQARQIGKLIFFVGILALMTQVIIFFALFP